MSEKLFFKVFDRVGLIAHSTFCDCFIGKIFSSCCCLFFCVFNAELNLMQMLYYKKVRGTPFKKIDRATKTFNSEINHINFAEARGLGFKI